MAIREMNKGARRTGPGRPRSAQVSTAPARRDGENRLLARFSEW